ncbi:MAG: NfeD family protein [Clostridioides sp.]|nr:NfeD family protein [Clostridioides sp.]
MDFMKIIWIIVGVAFAIAELIVPSLTMIWFSVGALIALILSFVVDNVFAQLAIFSIVSVPLFILATKYFVKKDENYTYNTNLQAVINKRGIVKFDILPNKPGIVVVDREEWTSVSVDNKEILAGQMVEVLRIEGVKLVVKKLDYLSE